MNFSQKSRIFYVEFKRGDEAMTTLQENIKCIGQQAKGAALELATLSGEIRKNAISLMPEQLLSAKQVLQTANAADMEQARSAGVSGPMLKRLQITDKVFDYMLTRLHEVALLPDPLNRVLEGFTRPNGLRVKKISVPLGVIGVIYESRPNVTTDAASVLSLIHI